MTVTFRVALVVLCAAAFVWDGILARAMIDQLHMNDFGKFYYSSRAFLDGRDMYAPSPATDLKFPQAPELRLLNMNPPHFHLLVLPLARLQPSQAVSIWMAAGIFALILSILLIAREISFTWTTTRLLSVAFGTLAFSGTQAFFGTGQLSMLLLLPMTMCWVHARRGRWIRAGVWLGGCMSVKPFLLIFVPYLMATRRFRIAAVSLATAAGGFAIGWLVFGFEAYVSWYRAVSQSGEWGWAPMNASAFGFFQRVLDATPFFAPVLLKPEMVKLWIIVAALVGVVSLAVATLDRTPLSTDRAFAMLLVAAQLISPLGWIYYLWLPAGSIAALTWCARGGTPSARWPRALAAIAIAGFLWPVAASYLFQPHRWATPTFGSVPFWATAALWVWLLVDFLRSRGALEPDSAATLDVSSA